MNPTRLNEATVRTQWTVVLYQSTHNTGGTIMGTNPRDSALSKYLQSTCSWSVPTCFRTMRRTIQPGRSAQAFAPRELGWHGASWHSAQPASVPAKPGRWLPRVPRPDCAGEKAGPRDRDRRAKRVLGIEIAND
jgi:hypothetical protein